MQVYRPPAITTGLAIFLLLVQWQSKFERLELLPGSLFGLQLNRLSFYPMAHPSWLSFFGVVMAFLVSCGVFELQNGTVRTGVVLNILAVIPGVAFCILTSFVEAIFGPFDAYCAGLELWAFPLVAYSSLRSNVLKKAVAPVYPWCLPLIALALWLIAAPAEKRVGLVLSTASGYALGLGYLDKLVEPSTTVIEWIETKLARGIAWLGLIVTFVGEVEARELRKQADNASTSAEAAAASLSNLTGPASLTSA